MDSCACGTGTDMWSVGCIFFEMLTGRRLFLANPNKLRELQSIADRKGFPSPDDCREFKDQSLLGRLSKKFVSFDAILEEELPAPAAAAKGLIMAMLEWKPSRRITAHEALRHPLLQNVVAADSLAPLQHPEQGESRRRRERPRRFGNLPNLPVERVTPHAIVV